MNVKIVDFILVTLLFSMPALGREVQPFEPSLINAAHSERTVVFHVWGLSCSSCVADLPKWAKFAERHKNIQFNFVEAERATAEEVNQRINRLNLDRFNNYYVANDLTEKDEYSVDPAWQGETPFTLIIKNGRRSYFFGPLTTESAQKVLRTE